jgi:autotransporter adhesin
VTADNTVSIGTGARAGAANSVALGAGSTADRGAQSGYEAYGLDAPQSSSGELNVGNRQITGVAAGSAGNDAVNVDQLRGAMSMFNRSLGGLSERIDSVEKHAYAGTAAAMAARQGIQPRNLDVKALQRRLLECGFYLGDQERLRDLGLVTASQTSQASASRPSP